MHGSGGGESSIRVDSNWYHYHPGPSNDGYGQRVIRQLSRSRKKQRNRIYSHFQQPSPIQLPRCKNKIACPSIKPTPSKMSWLRRQVRRSQPTPNHTPPCVYAQAILKDGWKVFIVGRMDMASDLTKTVAHEAAKKTIPGTKPNLPAHISWADAHTTRSGTTDDGGQLT